jgi:hypothetical protein
MQAEHTQGNSIFTKCYRVSRRKIGQPCRVCRVQIIQSAWPFSCEAMQILEILFAPGKSRFGSISLSIGELVSSMLSFVRASLPVKVLESLFGSVKEPYISKSERRWYVLFICGPFYLGRIHGALWKNRFARIP